MGGERVYDKRHCVLITGSKVKWGELTNMRSGFPIPISKHAEGRTVEHVYQALKHPYNPELQARILSHPSPIGAKHIAYTESVDPIWDSINKRVMWHLVSVKYAHYLNQLKPILEESGELPIVEYSKRDAYWGAVPSIGGSLVGCNYLGRIWMDRRSTLKGDPSIVTLPHSDFEFKLFDKSYTGVI